MYVMTSDKKFLKVGNRNEGNGLGQTFNQKKIKIDNNTKEECLVN